MVEPGQLAVQLLNCRTVAAKIWCADSENRNDELEAAYMQLLSLQLKWHCEKLIQSVVGQVLMQVRNAGSFLHPVVSLLTQSATFIYTKS
jgi:hypothetical protein